ncbi:PREDICTED: c-C motif chemokine 16 [Chrysochloris asiatica]|uniref:C-C motif chemokine n=1 Tax=Chrysochloris asiatica TaxID=185453 RepID=A0A9B0SZY3_CHRAS|nr:PREDICTED: c-C motif chemokine 16 [Chrysochloris asiatica]
MKVPVAVLLLFIFTMIPAFHSQSKIPESVNQERRCCIKYYDKVLLRKLVVGYIKALNCHVPAIIFITKKNREICTNPNDSWVQEYIKDPNLPLLPSKVSITTPKKIER